MFKKIAVVLLLLVSLLLGYAATRPDTFSVERSELMKPPPEKIFPLINDFHNWPFWSPWEKMDPEMKRTHTGAPAGKGAAYAWEGDKKVGIGRMEIIESIPPSKILIQLDFLKPFKSRNETLFTLASEQGGTRVTWAMNGPANFISKLMGVFCDIDDMVGKDFEAGLTAMGAAAEKPAS